jgi:cytochrome c oxidase assembly protein subunit 15
MDIYVNHIRLAAHFIAAMVLICYALVFWMMLIVPFRIRMESNAQIDKLEGIIYDPELRYFYFPPKKFVADSTLKNYTLIVLLILTIQLIYGAFMAGLKAAPAAPTWPDMNGIFIPDLDGMHPTNNRIAVQFIHRSLAYTLLVLLVAWWIRSKKHSSFSLFNAIRNWTLGLTILQVTLGVLSVLNSLKIIPGRFGTFEWLALSHQLVGMLLLLSLTAAFYLLRRSHKV